MIERNTEIAIVGLGLLGGSYARGLFEAGYLNVTGIDTDPEAIIYGRRMNWLKQGGSDPALIKDADIVISALYPSAFIRWVKENRQYFKNGAILTDVTGIKRAVIREIGKVLPEGVEFVSCHPMAGREFRGIQYSDPTRFEGANYIIINDGHNTPEALAAARDLAEILKFRHIAEMTSDEHDEMIGYLSQLTHVIAVSLMNANDNTHLAEYTGDSFRDLTRIASINEMLWPELFILNKDYLTKEIDAFVQEMTDFRDLIDKEDVEGMKEKLILSTERRKAFGRK